MATTLLATLLMGSSVGAMSLKMQPLIYTDSLAKAEKKKGFVDISNPTGKTIHLKTSVQAFRQVDNDGSLRFYDDPQIQAGITPDLEEFDLGPREAIRMYFLIDGAKLPSGDVFGALFVSIIPSEPSGVGSSVRVGTLFTLINGTPGSRNADVTLLDVPFWNFGSGVAGSYQVKNPAEADAATGFFPSVTVALDPLHHQRQVESKLVLAGHSRTTDFQINSDRLGFYKISAVYGQSKQEKWVFMMTGYWRIVMPILIIIFILSGVLFAKPHHRRM